MLTLLDDIGKTLGALTDVRMPGSLNGLKLTNTLKRGKSGLHVILMRGYNKEMLNASAFQGVGFRFFTQTLQARPDQPHARRGFFLTLESAVDNDSVPVPRFDFPLRVENPVDAFH